MIKLIHSFSLFYSLKATSKRRRTKQEILDDKAAALAKEQAIEDKLKTIGHLQAQLVEM